MGVMRHRVIKGAVSSARYKSDRERVHGIRIWLYSRA